MTRSVLPTMEQHANDFFDSVERLVKGWYCPEMPPGEKQSALHVVKRHIADRKFREAIDAAADIVKGLPER